MKKGTPKKLEVKKEGVKKWVKKIGKEKIWGKKLWVKKENPKTSGGKKKWGCQIGKNGGRLKYFLQKMLQKKEGLLIGKNLESQIGKNSGSGGKKKYG